MSERSDMDFEELRRLAEAATPGPWDWMEPHSVIHRFGPEFGNAGVPIAAIEGLFSVRHRNGEFIAAANPATILRLLDLLAPVNTQREAASAANRTPLRLHSTKKVAP